MPIMGSVSPGKGYEATLTLPTGKIIARAVNVDLDHPQDSADASSRAGAGFEEAVACLDSWSVSGGQIRVSDSDSYETLLTGFLERTIMSCVISVNGGKTRTGNCFVLEMSLDAPLNGVIAAPFKLQGTGILTFA